jgi:hypothetical protein
MKSQTSPAIGALPVLIALIGAAITGACALDEAASRESAGLATVYDSTGDTVRATVTGAVPPERIRQLVPELSIASERGDSVVFGNAGEFAIMPSGRVMLFDPTATQLLVFNPDGSLAAKAGRSGGGPGEYRDANGLLALGDSLFALYDAELARLSFFRPDGTFDKSWPLPPTNMFGQSMISGDRSDHIRLTQYVVGVDGDLMNARFALAAISDSGRALTDTVMVPTLGVKQAEYRAENTSEGRRASTMTIGFLSAGEFSGWHPDGHYVVMEGGGYRVLFARRDGKPLVVHRNAPPIAVAEDERKWHEERTYYIMRRTNPAWTWHGPAIPESRAAANGMLIARDGNVWVHVALPSVEVPEAERAPARPNAAPPRRWREVGEHEVFAADGRFLGRVALPPRTSIRMADGDIVWALQRDADDVPALVRLKVTPGWH